jgi:hypothetical protein
LKSELLGQCYPVLKLKVEIYTFAIVGGPKVDLTLLKNEGSDTKQDKLQHRGKLL